MPEFLKERSDVTLTTVPAIVRFSAKRILIGCCRDPHNNNGEMEILIGMVKILKAFAPGVDLAVLVSRHEVTKDRYKHFLDTHNVEVIKAPWFKEANSAAMTILYSGLSILIFILFKRSFLQQYDLYLELGADIHTDYYGPIPLYADICPLLLCILSRRPFVLCSETVGPFKSRLSKLTTRFVFSRASLITVRDEISECYLRDLGIQQRICG